MQGKTIEELVNLFLKRGGKINRYYLSNISRSKPSLVYFKGWHSGSNIKQAILKALAEN